MNEIKYRKIRKRLKFLIRYDKKLKSNKWKFGKHKSRELAGCMYKLNLKGANRVYRCNDSMIWSVTNLGHLRPYKANHCGNKLCWACNRQRYFSYKKHVTKTINKANQIIAKKYKGYKPLFLTFTVPNVDNGKDMHEAIQNMKYGINKMFDRVAISRYCLGTIKAYECPISKNTDELSYHPHIHVIGLFKSGFFSGKGYFKKSKWQEYYNHAMNSYERALVNVEPIKQSKNENGTQSTVLENVKSLAMYQSKPYNIFSISEYSNTGYTPLYNNERKLKAVKDYSIGLKRLQKVTYTGVFREASQIVKDRAKENKEHQIEYIPDNAPKFFIRYDDYLRDYIISDVVVPDDRVLANIKFKFEYEKMKIASRI